MRALQAEALKLFTTKLWLWLGLTLVALTGVLSFLIFNSAEEPSGSQSLTDGQELAEILSIISPIAYVIAAVLGIIGLTSEYRHQVITPTFLAMPHRWLVVLVKLVLYLVVGGVCGLLFVGILGGLAFPMLDGKGYSISLSDDVVAGGFGGVVVVSALFGALGVAIGALLRNQAFAITATVLYLFVVENILLAIPSMASTFPYLPGGAARALIYEDIDMGNEEIEMLTAGQSAIVLVMWAVVFIAIGLLVNINRDVT